MLIPQRQSRLQELLAQRGISDLDSLAAELNVSQSTIRRDLELLEHRGLAQRTHGGVIWLGERPAGAGRYAFDQRVDYQLDAKRKIALAAKSLVQPDQTILLDGGTTTYYLAQQLAGLSLQIITNSLPIAEVFTNDENVELIVSGGLLYPRYGVMLGPMAEQFLAAIHAQTLFLSVAGINDGSLYNQNLLLVAAERTMMWQSQQRILLADSGKFGQQALARLCDLKEINIVVSDEGLTESHRDAVRAAGCQLIIAGEDPSP